MMFEQNYMAAATQNPPSQVSLVAAADFLSELIGATAELQEAAHRLDNRLGGEHAKKGASGGQDKQDGPAPVLSVREEIHHRIELLRRRIAETGAILGSISAAIG